MFPVFANLGTRLGRNLVSQKSLLGGCGGGQLAGTHQAQHLCSFPLLWNQHPCGSTCLRVLWTQAGEGGCPCLQITSPSNSASPNKIGERQWEEMIVSWLFSERKQTNKKKANRSTSCILVQNLSLREKDLQFLLLLVLSPPREGCPGWWDPGCFSSLRKGCEGLREEPQRPFLPRQEQLKQLCLVGRQGPTLCGWRSWRGRVEEQVEKWEIRELMLVECRGVCRIGGLGGCVPGACCRKNCRGGERAGEIARGRTE